MAAKESEKDIAQQIQETFRNPQTKVDEVIRLYDQWKDYDKVSWSTPDSRKKIKVFIVCIAILTGLNFRWIEGNCTSSLTGSVRNGLQAG